MSSEPAFVPTHSSEIIQRAEAMAAGFAFAFERLCSSEGVNIEEQVSGVQALAVYAAVQMIIRYVNTGLGPDNLHRVARTFDVVFSITDRDGQLSLEVNSDEVVAARFQPGDEVFLNPQFASSRAN